MADEQHSVGMASKEGTSGEASFSKAQLNSPDSDNEAYAEDTPLTWVFGSHPKVKIITVLLSGEHDMNITDMAQLAGMSRSAVYDHLDDLLVHGIIKETREIGSSSMYSINKDSAIAQLIGQLEHELLDSYYEQTEE
jgi:DNA-binding transcriptional ArsR family regulator